MTKNKKGKKIKYGFMYRGNGYGYWRTVKETIKCGVAKALQDETLGAYKGFGVWKFVNGKADDVAMYWF